MGATYQYGITTILGLLEEHAKFKTVKEFLGFVSPHQAILEYEVKVQKENEAENEAERKAANNPEQVSLEGLNCYELTELEQQMELN